MADINDKLIFNLEVNAASFASELKKAVNSAVKNLTPTLIVKASDIKLQGKVKALDLIDLTGFAEALKASIQSAAGSFSPTGQAISKAIAQGGVLLPRPSVRPDGLTAKAVPGGNVVDIPLIAAKERAALLKAIDKEVNAFARAGERIRVSEFKQAEKEKVQAAKDAANERSAAESRFVKRLRGIPDTTGLASDSRTPIKAFPLPAIVPGLNTATTSIAGLSSIIGNLNDSLTKTRTISQSLSQILSTIGAPAIALFGKFNISVQNVLRSFGTLISQSLRFASISFGAIISAFSKIAGAARSALSPVLSLTSALVRSTAILTGSGLLFGGPAFIPVATVRAASVAFDELNSFTKDVSLSVVQFSDKIAALQGSDRVAFISDKFRELSASVQDTSTKFGLTSKDIASGLFEILSAQVGISSTAERLEALNASARVAVGGATDVASAFKGLVAINAAFNTSFEQASDKLFAIQRLGIAPVKELGPQLGRVASIASEAGANINELGAAISTITSRGIPLETTFTGLRQVFAELASSGGASIQKLVKEIRETKGIDITFDINTLRAEGGLKSFLDKLNEIRRIDPGLIGKLFPDTRSISVILPLLGSVSRFSKDLVQVAGARGEAEAASDAIVNTLAGSYDRLKAAISNNVVAGADHIASIIGLKEVIDDIIKSLDDFQKKIRGISFLDLKKFLGDLVTTKDGISSIVEFLSRKFGEISGVLLKQTAPILRIGAVLGLTLGKIIGDAIFGQIQESIRKSLPKVVALTDIFDDFGTEGKSLESRRIGPKKDVSIASSINDSLKESFKLIGNLEAFSAGIDVIFSEMEGVGKNFSKSILGAGLTLEKQFSKLTVSIDAGRIVDDAKSLRNVLEQEIEGIKPFDPTIINSFVNVIQKLQATNISKSVLGGIDDKNINDLFKSIGGLGSATIELKKAFIDLGADIKIPGIGESVEVIDEQIKKLRVGIAFLERKGFSDAAKNLSNGIKRLEDSVAGTFDKSVFEKLGIKDAGNDIRSQLVAVTNAVREFDSQIKGRIGTDEIKKKFIALRSLLKFLAIENLRLDVRFDFSSTEEQAKIGAAKASEFIKDALKTVSDQVFTEIPSIFGISSFKIPKFEISKIDRDSLQKQIQQTLGNFKGILSGIENISGFEILKKQVQDAIKEMEKMPGIVEKIKDSSKTIGDGFGEGFDQITILVADQERAFESFNKALRDTFLTQEQAAKRAAEAQAKLTEAYEKTAAAAQKVAELQAANAGLVGVQSAPTSIIDARNQTLNVIPGIGFNTGPIFFPKIPPK